MSVVNKETIANSTIKLDGGTYTKVIFKSCTLIYGGTGGPIYFDDCSFIDCSWEFDGAAANTLTFITSLAKAMGKDGQGFIKQIFKEILK